MNATGRFDMPGIISIPDEGLGNCAYLVELGSLPGVAGRLPRVPITAYCRRGERAMTAASVLERAGHYELSVIDGGFDGWRRLRGDD